MPAVTVRRRTPADVPLVAALIERQQPETRYPYRSPLPIPLARFVDRPGQLAAWVAEHDGEVVGHVGACAVPDDVVGRTWATALGRSVTGLGAVTALVVDRTATRRGTGAALMRTVEEHLTGAGLTPVLEVLTRNAAALALYRSRGWVEVATGHPDWLPAHEEPVRFLVLG